MNKNQNDNLFKMRHSAEHVLMHAMRNLDYKFLMAMGPATDEGFYFDFEILDGNLSDENFAEIEKEMSRIISLKLPITKEDISLEDARKLFNDNPYKQEWLDEIEKQGEKASVYYTAKGEKEEFADLCSGPHVKSTGDIAAIKLLSVAGAYWRGNEKNKMLTRIYGTAYPSQKELDEYLKVLEEVKKRDHRKLGKKLDLFTFSDYVGSGLPMFTPKGTLLRNLISEYLESIQEPLGYKKVDIPHIAKPELYKVSGHWDKFKDDLFHVHGRENSEFVIKPMNCPHHTQIYASKQRSYKDLPIRYSEITKVYRDESSGELQGLSRVRSITQDDGHVFCRPDQVTEEGLIVYKIINEFYKAFDMKPAWISLSTWDPNNKEKYLGSPEDWKFAESELTKVLEQANLEYKLEPGEAAFYGPKIDFMFKDSIGREWQLATIQFDYFMPKRFELSYVNKEGEKAPTVMIHRAICGSIERFLSILIEHFAGAFPVWLSPEQVRVISISDKHIEYAKGILDSLFEQDIRAELDDSDETMGNKIRKAQEQKIPYMLILGGKEQEANTVSIRDREGKQENGISLESFTDRVKKAILSRSLEL